MAKKKKWHVVDAPDGPSLVKTKVAIWKIANDDPRYLAAEASSYVCAVHSQRGDPKIKINRAKLIALLPELVEAAELLNSLAVDVKNMPPVVRKDLRRADRVVKKAVKLFASEPDYVPYE